jgi:hypothetical protein
MSKIFNLFVSRYFAIALAGAIFAATGAQAGPSRNLSLASVDPSPQAEQPTATAPQAAPTSTATPTAETPKQSPQTTAVEPSKPKARHVSTEARIISELHRHGIYW